MIYVISSSDSKYLIDYVNKQVKEKLKTLDEFNFQVFDCYNDLIQDALDFAKQACFSSSLKAALVLNCYFLSDQSKASTSFNKQQDLAQLEKYLSNQNPDCDLYLTTIGNINNSNSLVKKLKECAKFETLDKLTRNTLIEIGLNYLGNKKTEITTEALNELLNRIGEVDYSLYINYLDKLSTYANKINLADVEILIPRKIEDSIFTISNNLFSLKIKEALMSYRDLVSIGNQPIIILSQLATSFSFFYMLKKSLELGYTDSQIANNLKVNPGRIYYSKKAISNFSSDTILKMLVDLQNIEMNIKFELDDMNLALELFLANFKYNYFKKK